MTSAKQKEIIEKAVELGFTKSTNPVTGTQLKLKKFDARKLCEFSIVVMRHSVAESRDDRPPLYVGAVIYLPDGSVEFAYRGEMREGEHGEFTLLERKLRNANVEEGILFTTLEPCLDRTAPKRGCSKHIVSARIKKVYIGIEDDNPAVKGRGIAHMVKYGGVEYLMYEHELQDHILEANREFFEWARKPNETTEEEPIKLSEYEDSLPGVNRKDLSEKALSLYRKWAGIKAGSEAEFDRVLLKQRILVENNGTIVPTGFGLLLFGDDASDPMHQARLLARAELANGETSRQEFKSGLVLIPDELETWLKKVLPSTVDRSKMKRRDDVDLPFEMIREAVVNALVHRDYDIDQLECHLLIDKDTITIKSPGGPIPPITLEQMQSFNAPIKSRNPLVHYVFARMGFAEQQGFGLSSLKKQAEKLGLPLPRVSWEDPYLVLTIYRSAEGAVSTLDEDVLSKLSKSQRKGWEWLAKRGSASRAEYAAAMDIGDRTAVTHLSKLKNLGLVKPDGAGPSTIYQVTR